MADLWQMEKAAKGIKGGAREMAAHAASVNSGEN